MLSRLLLVGFTMVQVAVPAFAQVPATPQAPPALASVAVTTPTYDSAYYAWQSGNYPEALQRFEKMLTGPKAAEVLEPIALVTGELYVTTDVAPDGSQVRFSRDGKMLRYTTTVGSVRSVHLVSVTSGGLKPASTI